MSSESKTLNEKMTQLREMVAWFESDDFQIEKAFEHYKQAEELATEIEKELHSMRNEVNILKQKFE